MSSSSSSNIPDWSKLPDDLLILILNKGGLSRLEQIRLSSVCSSWRRVVRDHVSSSSSSPSKAVPWLLFPSKRRPEKGEDIDSFRRFYSVEEDQFYILNNGDTTAFKDFGKRRCIGSSHGWLILLHHGTANPFLLNPFSGTRILLPPVETFPDVIDVGRSTSSPKGYHIDNNKLGFIMSVEELRDGFFHKAILTSSPFKNEYGVILIYNNRSKLAFWKHGDTAWKHLLQQQNENDDDDCHYCYSDVICSSRNNGGGSGTGTVYALSSYGSGSGSGWSIEAWDFNKQHLPPVKLMQIKTPPPQSWNLYLDLPSHFVANSYLVETTSGDMLLVIRIILKPDTYKLWARHGHKTKNFGLFKLDFKLKQWINLNFLYADKPIGDQVLFLGGNHSLSLSLSQLRGWTTPPCSICNKRDLCYCLHYYKYRNLQESSICYTDDSWHWIYSNPLAGGHDRGMFPRRNFSDGEIYSKIDPPPFWVVPNPW